MTGRFSLLLGNLCHRSTCILTSHQTEVHYLSPFSLFPFTSFKPSLSLLLSSIQNILLSFPPYFYTFMILSLPLYSPPIFLSLNLSLHIYTTFTQPHCLPLFPIQNFLFSFPSYFFLYLSFFSLLPIYLYVFLFLSKSNSLPTFIILFFST